MRYTATARWLHWLTVPALLVIAALGLWLGYAAPADEALKMRLYTTHESLGFCLGLLTLFRLAWRAGHPPPPIIPPLPRAMRLAAHLNHAGLYILLLVQPVVGLLSSNAWGFPLVLVGLMPLPMLIGKDEALAPLLTDLHGWIALMLGLLVALHVAAALWHHLARRDNTLRRMTTGGSD
ncbi:cytochrome b [Pseudoroseomonas globiformis]|uniref:Cytochrome b n=1 Tax=Teichococcus globiformis TaxID=2307229 RepID=A0ABV7G0Y2_9PROT